MLHILTIIGARPQIIKAAAISRAIRENFSGQIRETIVHTGQHYDENMSQVFFDELGVPVPDHNLNIGSGSHGRQTAAMIAALEEVLVKDKPDAVLVYGDTNSTLAGAVAASKIHIPVVHVEAGLRSFNKRMPEEINRVMCDHVSTLLFAPTAAACENLVREGIMRSVQPVRATADVPAVFHCGDIMYDNSLHFAAIAAEKSSILEDEKLGEGEYFLATVHRDNNTDDPEKLREIFEGLIRIAETHDKVVLMPLHPRTRLQLKKSPELEKQIEKSGRVRLLPPASFLDMISLEKNAALVVTDSGGVQKEAFFFKRPCVILREETEWVELVEHGAAILAGSSSARMEEAAAVLLQKECVFPPLFGDGAAGRFICAEMLRHLA
jgi:UDP-GlcNAc3NAcA epimerase